MTRSSDFRSETNSDVATASQSVEVNATEPRRASPDAVAERGGALAWRSGAVAERGDPVRNPCWALLGKAIVTLNKTLAQATVDRACRPSLARHCKVYGIANRGNNMRAGKRGEAREILR